MNGKRLTVKRIIIFVLLSYGLSWALAGLFFLPGIFDEDVVLSLSNAFAMLTPAIASLITRRITKEGMENSLLRLNIEGNVKYYLLAVALPLIYAAVTDVLSVLVLGEKFDLNAVFEYVGVSAVGYTAVIFFNIALSIGILPLYLGEELGWRGYMFPKLKTVMKLPAAYIAGGIIWGAWHTPAIIGGHNFGKDYTGYPYLGVLAMCFLCIAIGIIFTWLTEKTNSVYPAAIAHAINNNVVSLVTAPARDLSNTSSAYNMQYFYVMTAAIFIVAAVCIAESVIAQRRAKA